MPGVLVFGDINVDLLARLDVEPGWGQDHLVPAIEQECGGVGANVAVALRRWGVAARLVGCVGRDAFGDLALRFLEAEGVDLGFVQRTDGATTGLIFIPVGPDGQRTIFGARGANAHLAPLDRRCLEGVGALFLVGYDFLSPATAAAAWLLLEEAGQRGLRVVLDVGVDPSRRVGGTILEAARRVDVLCVGEGEARALYGCDHLASALDRLRSAGPEEILVKRGAEGSLVLEAGGWRHVPAIAVASRDSTGAGDAFAAAYLYARQAGGSRTEAALVASAAGAAAAAAPGAAAAMPTPEQVAALLRHAALPAAWEAERARLAERLKGGFRLADAASSGGRDGTPA